MLHGRLRDDLLPAPWTRQCGGATAQAWPQTQVRISLCACARDVPLDRLRRRVFRGGAAWRGCRQGGQRVLVDEYEWEEHSAADGGVVYVVGTG